MSIDTRKNSRRGRPEVDSEEVRSRIVRPVLDALDAWAAAEGLPHPRRPEAVRRALADHLRAKGYLTAQETTSSLAEQIGDLEQEIVDMPADAPPSPEAAMNTMRQALANDDLTQLKNRRTVARKGDRQE